MNLALLVTSSLLVALGCGCSGDAKKEPGSAQTVAADRPPASVPASASASAAASAPPSLPAWVKANAKEVTSLALDSDDKTFAVLDGFVDADVDVMALGENAHGTHEYNQLRARVFRYLVEKHGYRAIVPETGIVEARLVELYVQGVPGVELTAALMEGFTHGMGRAEEARELLGWMRTYNQGKAPEQRVHFVGKDLSVLGDTLTVPLTPLMAYLKKVDPVLASSATLTATMAAAKKASTVTVLAEAAFKAKGAKEIDPDFLDAFSSISFEQLPADEQRALERGVTDLATHVAASAAKYTAASSADDYHWNASLAVVATQIMRDLRSRQSHPKIFDYDKVSALLAAYMPKVVVDKRPASDPHSHTMDLTKAADLRDQFRGRETREQALAENVEAAQKHYGKLMNFAHLGHVNKVGLEKISVFGVEFGDVGLGEGEFLFKTYGKRYALIGTTSMDFKDKDGKLLTKFEGAPVITVDKQPTSFEHDVVDLVRPRPVGIFIDLKHARDLPPGFGKRPFRWNDSFQDLELSKNYDAIFLFSAVSPQRGL